MLISNPRLKDLFLNKPECVIDFPEWLLSPQRIKECRAVSRLAIVEIAGRDSVAAAAKSVEEGGFTDLVPTYVYTGTEHGPWASVEEAVKRLARRLPEVRIHELVVLGSPGFWQALNGRFVSDLISRYGFYTPCVGCHLYLHSVRIPLALTLGKAPIVAGERQWHDNTIKVNQISKALDVYKNIAKGFMVPLLFPVRHIAEGDRIGQILGFEWEEGRDQLGCVLSGNYRRLDGSGHITARQVQAYLERFAGPVAKKIVQAYALGHVPDHLQLAAEVLGS